MAERIARIIVKAEAEALKHDSWFTADLIRRSTRAYCMAMSSALASTPYEYFNSLGDVDKRKVKRYRAKHGIKEHCSIVIKRGGE